MNNQFSDLKNRVLIFMSVFNGEKYLRDSIDSIINQTVTDFDFLIINDGSTDSTNDILNEYNDVSTPEVKIINFNNNNGLSYHLSRIPNYTQSDLIVRMDADDLSYPNRLENIIKAYKKYNFDWYNSIVEHIDSDNNSLGIAPDSYINLDYKNKYLYYMNFYCHGSAAFTTKALLNVGGYDASLTYAQDYDLWLKFLMHNKKFYFDPNTLYQQRITSESISQKIFNKQFYYALKISAKYPGSNNFLNLVTKFCYKYYNFFTRMIYSYFIRVFKKALLIYKIGK